MENQVPEYWCGPSDGSSGVHRNTSCSAILGIQQLPLNEGFISKGQMRVILLDLLCRLHVVSSDTRHNYLAYKATAQKASKDLSKATEEQRQKI